MSGISPCLLQFQRRLQAKKTTTAKKKTALSGSEEECGKGTATICTKERRALIR